MEQVLAAAWVSRVGWGGKEALGLGIRRRAGTGTVGKLWGAGADFLSRGHGLQGARVL